MFLKNIRKIKRRTILLPILIPVMNLFLILLPFVLETSLLQELTTHEIMLPSLKSTEDQKSVDVEVILDITRDSVLLKKGASFLKINFDKNFVYHLKEELKKLKKDFPDVKSIQLRVDDNVIYQVLIDVMDICKSEEVGFEEIIYIDEVK